MGLIITTSPDIAFLDFNILYDISVGIPSITLTNRSVSATSPPDGLANCTWWYVITTPSGVSIHSGSETNPDAVDEDWVTFTIPANSWPTPGGTPPYGQIEFSGAVPYSATLYVKDSDGNIFSLLKQVTICRPNGNIESSWGNFGAGRVEMLTKCELAKIYGTDITNYTYQSILGTSQTSTWTLRYPMDSNGNEPPNAVATNKPSVIFPVQYNADGYQLYMNTYSTYDMGNGQSIKVQYKFLATFAVLCNVNLGEVQCEIDKLAALLPARCGTAENLEVKDRYQRLVGLQVKCLTGINQPLLGIDVPGTIAEMKKILGRDFDCGCSIGSGISSVGNTTGSIIISLDITGNMTGDVTNEGDNYVIHLQLPGGSGIPALELVTGIGNTSSRPIIVGSPAGNNNKMDILRQVISQGSGIGAEIYAGWGQANAGETFGSFWLHKIGFGTVYFRPHAASNTYILVMPPSQGSANTYLKNDGAGNLSWAASAASGLQAVTDVGNVTTNPMISGDTTAANAIFSDVQIALFLISALRIGLLINNGIPTLKIGGATFGFVSIIASGGTNDYQIVLPPAQGGAGSVLRNDGSGNLSWSAVTAQDLQSVATVGNIATLAILSGILSGNYGSLADTIIGLYNNGVFLGGLKNTAGQVRLEVKDNASIFTTTVVFPTGLSASRVFFNPSYRNGTYALIGTGVHGSITPGAGAGTGGTASFPAPPHSDDNKGLVSVSVGSSPAANQAIVQVLFAVPYDDYPVVIIQGVSLPTNAAVALSGNQQVYVQSSVNGFTIWAGPTALTAGTIYSWNYIVQR